MTGPNRKPARRDRDLPRRVNRAAAPGQRAQSSCRVAVHVAIAIVGTYLWIAGIAYEFRHPDLTDTQRILRIWEAVTWR